MSKQGGPKRRKTAYDPAALTADGIVAAYLRRRSPNESNDGAAGKAMIPFIYNLLDFLSLALPEQTELRFGQANGAVALSTRTGGAVAIDPRSRQRVALGADKALWIDVAEAMNDDRLKTVSHIVTRAQSVANAHGIAIRPKAMATGLQHLLSHFQGRPKQAPANANGGCGDAGPCDQGLLDRLVDESAATLAPALPVADGTYTFVIRYWGRSGPHLRRLAAPGPVPSAWKIVVDQVLCTGFCRYVGTRTGGLVVIPCHFLGAPWLVACRELPRASSAADDAWWRYATYRDHSVFNATLRAAASSCLLYALGRGLVAAQLRHEDPAAFQQAVQKAWTHLQRIYPTPRPVLLDVTGESTGSGSFRVGSREYVVRFDDSPNPYFAPYSLPPLDAKEEWAALGKEAVARFSADLRARALERSASTERAVARSAYAVGHPLKHRYGEVISSLNAIASTLRDAGSATSAPYRLAESAKRQAQSCQRIAELMNLMGAVLRAGTVAGIDEKFFELAQLDLQHELHSMFCDFNSETVEHRVVLEGSVPPGVVACAITTLHGKRRLPNDFYRELLFEALINVRRHGSGDPRKTRVSLKQADRTFLSPSSWALCFSNTPANPHHLTSLPGLTADTWTEPDDRWQGGLRIMAEWLRLTTAGALTVRVSQRPKRWEYTVRIELLGLTGDSAKRGGLNSERARTATNPRHR